METELLRAKIRKLIALNKTEEAFELLSNVQLSELDKELIMLNSQFNRIQEEIRLNVTSREEAERRINQINLTLLELSNKIDAKRKPEANQVVTAGRRFNPILLGLLLIPLTALLVFASVQMFSNSPLPDPDAVYYIKSQAAGAFLDVHAAGKTPGTNLTLYGGETPGRGHFNQEFRFVAAGDGYYYLESTLKERLVIDIDNFGTADGTNAQLVIRGDGTKAQKFKLLKAENGLVKIVSAMGDNLCLGVNDEKDNVVLRANQTDDHILFKLYRKE